VSVLVVIGIAHLLGVLKVPSPSPAAWAVTSTMADPSLLGTGGVEPLFKTTHPWSFLSVSTQYAHGGDCWFMLLLLLQFVP
jgi:hypothetical protein